MVTTLLFPDECTQPQSSIKLSTIKQHNVGEALRLKQYYRKVSSSVLSSATPE